MWGMLTFKAGTRCFTPRSVQHRLAAGLCCYLRIFWFVTVSSRITGLIRNIVEPISCMAIANL